MENDTAWGTSQTLTSTSGVVINGTNGFRLDGVTAGDHAGWSVAAGDVNNDGYADVIIGAANASYSASNAGSTYVVFGRMGTWLGDGVDSAVGTGTYNLTSSSGSLINGTKGFRLDGVNAVDNSGASVTSADINNDGYKDVIIGASGANSRRRLHLCRIRRRNAHRRHRLGHQHGAQYRRL